MSDHDSNDLDRNSSSGMESNNSSSNSKISSSEEYFRALEKWIHEAYMWQSLAASFPYFLWFNHCANQPSLSNYVNVPGSSSFVGTNHSSQNYFHQQIFRNEPIQAVEGIECKIPPIWKRLIAEFLDFSILFILKLGVTFIAIDFFEIIDLDKFDFDLLYKDVKLDYKTAIQMTQDIMLLEIMHRILVCIFETLWLAKGFGGRIGGATPGKTMLGLCVVRCESVTSLSPDDELLLIKPGTDLGLKYAFIRSLIKNLVLSIFIPASFAFLYFRYNRASYDMLCSTIVVEEPTRRLRPHQQ